MNQASQAKPIDAERRSERGVSVEWKELGEEGTGRGVSVERKELVFKILNTGE